MVGIVYQGKDTIMRMKTNLFTALILGACVASTTVAQVPTRQVQAAGAETLRYGQQQFTTDPATGAPIPVEDKLKRFDLTFPGGTPAEFIEAINDQADLRVNVIIPPEFAKEEMPPMEVFDVTLPQLFEAGIAASTTETNMITGTFSGGRIVTIGQRQLLTQSKGFRTTDRVPSEHSIWYLYVERASHPPETQLTDPAEVRVYQLSNLLSAYSIEDITTAIKTTWEMLDSKTKPEMKFHAETKLLVAKGTEEQLAMIEMVTKQLGDGAMWEAQNRQFERDHPSPPRYP